MVLMILITMIAGGRHGHKTLQAQYKQWLLITAILQLLVDSNRPGN